MTCATPRITHVMQTVEACHEVEARFLDVLGARLLKAYAITQPMCDSMSICPSTEGAWKSYPTN